ncbi:enoyl-CoA hydratase-related protein [Spongiactinospora sp. TRM90649]|uniref:enoyl-CoA hydratase/isomerase family protein n=1 Tax=Spongiactinospora sp. TRM90649 TaxID=3031114 RepID=UPI0023F97549|nr:enoyl-CoA hydratase-related protein [Spongiactinospora sp. TRM90649]MDF5753180.1 enoyl-CoA hydratase-related protein [Spongiactinospora sp. TRM90649]
METAGTGADEPVDLSIEGHVAYVTLDRPDVLNAVNSPMYRCLLGVFAKIEDAADVRCVVVRGRGRAFCVGADQTERAKMSVEDLQRRRRLVPRVFSAMYHCSRPVVAQVHGYALGGGLELALSCDIVVAAEDTVMGLIETTLGSMPGGGGTQLLPRLVGIPRAKELIFTGRRFTGVDARQWGLVSHAVPAADVEARVDALAAEISAAAPLAVVQAKRAIDLSTQLEIDSGVELEAELYKRLLTSTDRLEGLAAAREGRPPRFRGE